MKNNKTKSSKRTIILTAAAAALFLIAGVIGALAAGNAPDIRSDDLEADFQLQHLGVHLMENGKAVGKRSDNVQAGNGVLLSQLKGKFVPGRVYEERIAAQNRSDTDQYVRIILKKYWQTAGRDGKLVKDTELDPALIHLTYGEKAAYNTGAWAINPREHSTESDTYYYRTSLKGSDTVSADLVNRLKVDGKIVKDITEEKSANSAGQMVIKKKYKYDGKYICLEADVQSIQTHNPNKAIRGEWGVTNVSAADGSLTVGE